MASFHSKDHFLDMEGVRGSNPRASTILSPNNNIHFERFGALFSNSSHRYRSPLISPEGFALVGTKVGQALTCAFSDVWDSQSADSASRYPHYLIFQSNNKASGDASYAHGGVERGTSQH